MFIINFLKIIFLLGFLIFIHEGGHFFVAKICKIKVKEFAIGFGPTIWKKQGKETKYAIRAFPLGGFVSMEGEDEISEHERSFSNASIPKRIAIVSAGAIVNIVFGLIIYFILAVIVCKDISLALKITGGFILSIVQSLKMLFSGSIGLNDLTGPVGISEAISQTTSFVNYVSMISLVSVSLGVTNLLPIPALDGGKILILIIEAIRKKPLNKEVEAKIQLIGFSILIALSLMVTFNDVRTIIS